MIKNVIIILSLTLNLGLGLRTYINWKFATIENTFAETYSDTDFQKLHLGADIGEVIDTLGEPVVAYVIDGDVRETFLSPTRKELLLQKVRDKQITIAYTRESDFHSLYHVRNLIFDEFGKLVNKVCYVNND